MLTSFGGSLRASGVGGVVAEDNRVGNCSYVPTGISLLVDHHPKYVDSCECPSVGRWVCEEGEPRWSIAGQEQKRPPAPSPEKGVVNDSIGGAGSGNLDIERST